MVLHSLDCSLSRIKIRDHISKIHNTQRNYNVFRYVLYESHNAVKDYMSLSFEGELIHKNISLMTGTSSHLISRSTRRNVL